MDSPGRRWVLKRLNEMMEADMKDKEPWPDPTSRMAQDLREADMKEGIVNCTCDRDKKTCKLHGPQLHGIRRFLGSSEDRILEVWKEAITDNDVSTDALFLRSMNIKP